MKTQINFKNGILLILTLFITTIVWSNTESPEGKNNIVESNVSTQSAEQFAGTNADFSFHGLESFLNVFTKGETSISNYPEPFEIFTDITYELEMASNVEIDMYNGLRLLIKLVDTYQKAGKYTITLDAADLPSGDYTLVMVTEFGTYTKSMRK